MNFLHTLTGSLSQPAAGNPTVATLNKVAKVFGLKVGFVSAR